jgi:hypothetical protein
MMAAITACLTFDFFDDVDKVVQNVADLRCRDAYQPDNQLPMHADASILHRCYKPVDTLIFRSEFSIFSKNDVIEFLGCKNIP